MLFLQNIEATEVIKTTDILSPIIKVAQSMFNRNLTSRMSSVAIIDTTYSDP
jgi:hypothetical protein